MARHKIAVIAGDGIGKEVVPEGIRVLEAVGARHGIGFEWDELPWSCDYYLKHGRMMPEDGLERLRGHDAIDAHSAECDAAGRGQMGEGALALVAVGKAAIANVKLPAPAAAAHDTIGANTPGENQDYCRQTRRRAERRP